MRNQKKKPDLPVDLRKLTKEILKGITKFAFFFFRKLYIKVVKNFELGTNNLIWTSRLNLWKALFLKIIFSAITLLFYLSVPSNFLRYGSIGYNTMPESPATIKRKCTVYDTILSQCALKSDSLRYGSVG